jgi:hypothetical protein
MKKTKSKFKCELEFRNPIPEPPLGPKLLAFPTNLSRLYEYGATALDEQFKVQHVYLFLLLVLEVTALFCLPLHSSMCPPTA